MNQQRIELIQNRTNKQRAVIYYQPYDKFDKNKPLDFRICANIKYTHTHSDQKYLSECTYQSQRYVLSVHFLSCHSISIS